MTLSCTHYTYQTSLQDRLNHPKISDFCHVSSLLACVGSGPLSVKHIPPYCSPAQHHCMGMEEREHCQIKCKAQWTVHTARAISMHFQPPRTPSGMYCLQLHHLSHPGSRGAPVMRQILTLCRNLGILLQGKLWAQIGPNKVMPSMKDARRCACHRLRYSLRMDGWHGSSGLACAKRSIVARCNLACRLPRVSPSWREGPHQRMHGLRAVVFCLAA